MSIPTLLVCDGDDASQEILEGLVKNEPGLRYIATVSKKDGSRAVEQAIKVGTKLLWIDLDDEPVEGLNLLAETRQLYPQLPVVVSKSELDADMVRASVNLGALDFLDPTSWATQVKIVVAKLQAGSSTAAATAAALPAQPAPAAALAQSPVVAPAPTAPPAPAAPYAPAAPAAPAAPPIVPSPAAAAPGKWGDLDSIGSGASGAPVPGPALAPNPTPVPAAAPAPVNLGVASTASAPAAKAQEATGEIHLTVTAGSRPGNASAVGVMPQEAPQQSAPESGNKWGDLDSIGSASAPAPTTAAAASPAPATPAQTAAPASASDTGGPKWGDLDAIPTPKATAEIVTPIPKPIHAASDEKWGELDSIAGPGEKRGPAPNSLVTGSGAGKGLKRPAPEKAEMYNIPAVPIWMIILILLVIGGCVYYMAVKPH